jgi:hypothetical protein
MLQRPSQDSRLQVGLERRLSSAPPVFARAVVAPSLSFEPPDFDLTTQQQAAAEVQLECLADARAAFRGRPDDDFNAEDDLPNTTHMRYRGDRLSEMCDAITRFDQASRNLRQRGLKLVLTELGCGTGRANMTYRQAVSIHRPRR